MIRNRRNLLIPEPEQHRRHFGDLLAPDYGILVIVLVSQPTTIFSSVLNQSGKQNGPVLIQHLDLHPSLTLKQTWNNA